MAETTLSLSYKTDSKTDDSKVSNKISIALDETANIEEPGKFEVDSKGNKTWVEPKVKTSFLFGETAYLKVLRTDTQTPYSLYPSFGDVQFIGEGFLYSVTQELTFVDTDEASLSEIPIGGVDYVWNGNKPEVSVEFKGDKVKLGAKIPAGIMVCNYKIMGERWALTCDKPAVKGTDQQNILVSAIQKDSTDPTKDLTASVNVTFGTKKTDDKTDAAADGDVQIALDDEKNKEVYGDKKSSFKFGEKAYLKVVVSDASKAYNLDCSWGTATKEASGLSAYTEDQLSFTNSDSATLKALPNDIPKFRWFGKKPDVGVTFDGKNVKLSTKVTAVMDVAYDTNYDQWSVVAPYNTEDVAIPGEHINPMPSNVVVIQGDKSASCSVTFEDTSEQSIELSLDETANKDAAGKEKTQFVIPDVAYLKVILSNRSKPYTLQSSWGKLAQTGNGLMCQIEETMTFSYSAEASIKNDPVGGVESAWLGNPPAASLQPLFSGKTVTLKEKATAILKCRYWTYYDQWSLSVSEAITDPLPSVTTDSATEEKPSANVAVTALQEDGKGGFVTASTTVTFLGNSTIKKYKIRTSECGGGTVVPNATVYFNGMTLQTGTDGLCVVGELATGTYPIDGRKEGQIPATTQVQVT